MAFNSDADGLTTAAEGSMVLIKTLTASTSDTLSFVDGTDDVVLDNTYPTYMFKFINMHPGTDNVAFQFNMSADSGSNYNVTKTTTFFEAYHKEDGTDTAGPVYAAGRDLAQGTGFQDFSGAYIQDEADDNLSGTLHLFNPSSTTFIKNFISSSMQTGHSAIYAWNTFVAGYGNTTSAVDAVQFKMSSGNIDAGDIKLYGIKDS